MKFSKFCVLLLTVAILALSCSKSESTSGGSAQSGPVTLRLAITLHAMESAPVWDTPIGKMVTERTNVVVEGEYWPETTAGERRNLILASGDLPDLIYVSRDQAFLYGAEGVFEPLDDLLAQYTPHFLSYITPDNSSILKSPNDDKMYFVPLYYKLNTLTEWTFDYRRDILEEMGEPEPTTMDEWYQLFKKVQAQYPDMTVLSERGRNVDMFTHAAFDMGRIDGNYGIIGSDYDKHQIVYLPITNEWRDMLQYYAKLYAENILDHEYLTIQYNDWWERKIGGGRAFACWTMNMSRADQANELAHTAGLNHVEWRVAHWVKNYKTGERVQYKTANPWRTDGFALNAESTVKEAAMKYIDFFFTDDFSAFHYYSTDPRYNELYEDRTKMTEWDWGKYIGYSGFFYTPQFFPYSIPPTDPPKYASEEHFETNMGYVKAIPSIARRGNIESWLTTTTDLSTYVNTAMDEFITGRRSFGQWDAYVAEIKQMGVDAAVATVQEWYTDYWNSL